MPIHTKLFVALLGASLSGAALALDVDPGDYTALPAGVNAFVLYAQFAERDALYADGSKAPVRAKLSSQVGIARYLRVVRIDDRWTVDPQVLLPFGRLKAGDDLAALGRASGVGDVILAAAFKLKLDEAAGEVFGITPFLILPTGRYDADKPLNLGENRRRVTLQAGYTRPLATDWRWDIVGDGTWFGKNDDCRAACGSASPLELKQKTLYQLQNHLRFATSPTSFVAASYSIGFGGETSVAGVHRDDEARVQSLKLHGAMFLSPTTQVLATIGRDIKVENGLRENLRLNLRLFKVF